jgi:hypothetical protein
MIRNFDGCVPPLRTPPRSSACSVILPLGTLLLELDQIQINMYWGSVEDFVQELSRQWNSR